MTERTRVNGWSYKTPGISGTVYDARDPRPSYICSGALCYDSRRKTCKKFGYCVSMAEKLGALNVEYDEAAHKCFHRCRRYSIRVEQIPADET